MINATPAQENTALVKGYGAKACQMAATNDRAAKTQRQPYWMDIDDTRSLPATSGLPIVFASRSSPPMIKNSPAQRNPS